MHALPLATQEREEREARRRVLREARKPLYDLPVDHMFEIPGRCAVAVALWARCRLQLHRVSF